MQMGCRGKLAVQCLGQQLQIVGIVHIHIHTHGYIDAGLYQMTDVSHNALIGVDVFIYIGLDAVVHLLGAVDGDLNVLQVPLFAGLLHGFGIHQIAVAGHRGSELELCVAQPVADETDDGLVEQRLAAKPLDVYLLTACMTDEIIGHLKCGGLGHVSSKLPQFIAVEAAGIAVAGGHNSIARNVGLRGLQHTGYIAELTAEQTVVVGLWYQEPMTDEF